MKILAYKFLHNCPKETEFKDRQEYRNIVKLECFKNANDRSETDLLFPANDLVNGCPDHLSIFRNFAVLYEGFVFLTDHMLLLSVISVDDVLVF